MAIGGVGMKISHDQLMMFLPVGFVVFFMTGIYLLIKNGEFIKSDAFRFTGIGISVILVGAMFKVMLWPGAGIMLALGFLSFVGFYLYYMLRYKHTTWVNFLKLFFLLSMAIGRLLQMSRFPYSENISIIGVGILVILLIDFIVNKKGEEKKRFDIENE